MNKETETSDKQQNGNDFSLSEFDLLDEEEGNGPYCCGKRMVDRGIMLVCLNCGAEENSSS